MADDRMKEDDLRRDMGTGGREDQDTGKGQGQHTPGRNPQGEQQTGGQQGGQQKEPLNREDDELGGTSGQRGGQNR